MSKYDDKILELYKGSDSIIELLRRKKMTGIERIIDLVFTNSITTLDGLNIDGAYYLVAAQDTINLVHIDKLMNIHTYEVTDAVNTASNPKKFEFEGNYYKVFRKVI